MHMLCLPYWFNMIWPSLISVTSLLLHFPPVTQVLAGPHAYQAFNSPKVYVIAVPCAFLTHALDIYRDHSHII